MADHTADTDWIDCHSFRRDAEARGGRDGESVGSLGVITLKVARCTTLRLIEPDCTTTEIPIETASPATVGRAQNTARLKAAEAEETARALELEEARAAEAAAAAAAVARAKAKAQAQAKAEADKKAKAAAEAAAAPAPMRVLLLKPSFAVPTPQAYARWIDSVELPGIRYAAQEINGCTLVNDLERPVFEKHRVLAGLKQWLLERRECRAGLLSGSGSTVFAILHDEADAKELARAARHEIDPNFWTWAGVTGD